MKPGAQKKAPGGAKGWRTEMQLSETRVILDQGGAGETRDPSGASGMMFYGGNRRAWNQGGTDESTNRGEILQSQA